MTIGSAPLVTSSTTQSPLPRLNLRGVDHTARPTWKLGETIHFYREVLGLPLVHVIAARGWGPPTHPDFLHFFFDSGNGSTIAFFYYLGSEAPATLEGRSAMAPWPEDHVFDATHTAWLVDEADGLGAWKARLESFGLNVSVETEHEIIESIYVRDPNGYFIEFTRKLRPLHAIDAQDAWRTLDAALHAQELAQERGDRVDRIEEIYAVKAQHHDEAGEAPVQIYVPRVSEFQPLVDAARGQPACRVRTVGGYDVIEANTAVEFQRKALGVKPAIWYSMLSGGLRGRIGVYDRDVLRIEPLAA